MGRLLVKVLVFTLSTVLLLVGCGAAQTSQAASTAAKGASSVPDAVPAPGADSMPDSQSASDQGGSSAAQEMEVAPTTDWFVEDGAYFDPFAQEKPARPDGPFVTASQADIETMLMAKQQVSWLYRMEDTNLAYQYRFLPGNRFVASLGMLETDSGVYSYGTYRFLEDGLLEAMVWVPDDPVDPAGEAVGADDYREDASPVYMTAKVEWPGDSREEMVLTLLTLEDTTPHKLMERYFLKTAGVSLPLALEEV